MVNNKHNKYVCYVRGRVRRIKPPCRWLGRKGIQPPSPSLYALSLLAFFLPLRLLKLVLGLAGVLVIKTFLSAPLTAIFGNEYIARAVRYFLIVMFAGSVWPLTFKWFKKL